MSGSDAAAGTEGARAGDARPGRGAPDADARVADAPRRNWVDAFAPRATRPYLRLMRADRPIGAWLLLLPGWQAIALATVADPAAGAGAGAVAVEEAARLAALFFVGAFVMRAAGCVLNDIVDRDIDRKVARTRARPLASGALGLGAALATLAALCAIGLAILASFNAAAILLGLAAALPVAVYPFMKRITWWPQAFLGIAFSWGALLGWTAATGEIGWPSVALYLGGIAWTIGYDTIYAHQDREDDALIGVKSTARLFGARSRVAIAVAYALAVLCAGLAGALAGLGPLFYLGLAGYALHLGGQVARLDIDDGALCLHLFRANRAAGLLLVAAILLGGA